MIELEAKIRKKFGRRTNSLREKGIIPAVLYGIGIKNVSVEVDEKEFEKVYKESGESSLIFLKIDNKKYQVLIHDIVQDPIQGKFLHVDFYHPSSHKEVTAEVSLIFEGEEEIQKNLTGNLIKEIQSVEVKGLPQDLPKEIKVDLTGLKNIGDKIQIKDLKVLEKVKILRDSEETVAVIVAAEKFEEEKEIIKEEKPTEEEKEGEGEVKEKEKSK